MATTIQIKRGTSSAVPSGLADGELAINLDNGQLYFGSGSNSVNDFTFGSLNATSLNVTSVTSSIVTSSIVLSEGSNTFGDALTDTQTFNGHITASGDISASGELQSQLLRFTAGANNYIRHTDTSGVQIKSTNLTLTGAVTASGNISSSGTITAATLDAAAVSDTLAAAIVAEIDNDEIPIAKLAEDAVTVTAGTGLTGGGSITLGGSATVNVIGGTGVTANANDVAIGQDVATTANVQFANITSSANISASGNIISNNLEVSNNITAVSASIPGVIVGNPNLLSLGDPDGNVAGVRAEINQNGTTSLLGNTTLNLKGNVIKLIDGSDNKTARIELSGPVTASGNISSSGTITAATLDAAAVTDALAAAIVAEIDNDEIPIAKLAEDAVTVTAGTGLTGGGSITLGGSATVNVIGGDGITANANDMAITAAQTTITSILAEDIKIGEDDETKIDFEDANEIHFYANNVEQVYIADNIFGPQSDSDVDLGSTGVRWKDAFVDSITVTGDVTASGNISSSGDITANNLTVDLEIQRSGDADTKIAFATNQVSIKAGNTEVFGSSITGSVLPNVHQNVFDTGSVALGANSAIGDIVKFGGGAGDTVAGGIYFLNGSGGWTLTQANAAATSTGSLAVAVGTNPSADGMCLRGFVNPHTDPGAGIGAPVYLSDTHTGRMLAAPPSDTNDVVRIVGYQYGTDLIYFNPSNDYIVHA